MSCRFHHDWEEASDQFLEHYPPAGKPGGPPVGVTHYCARCGAWGVEHWVERPCGTFYEDVPMIVEEG